MKRYRIKKGDNSIKKIEIILRIQENGKIEREIPILDMELDSEEKIVLSEQTLSFDNLAIDSGRRKVYLNAQEINLTSKEFDILFFLASYPGQVFTHHQIYESVWDKSRTKHRIRKSLRIKPVMHISKMCSGFIFLWSRNIRKQDI